MKPIPAVFLAFLAAAFTCHAAEQAQAAPAPKQAAPTGVVKIAVQADKPAHDLPAGFYGIFIEDVNGAADGGLYGELIKNRSFELKNPWAGWGSFGDVEIRSDDPAFKNNPHYVRLTNPRMGPRKWRLNPYIENGGFWSGIGLKEGESYRASFYARSSRKMKVGLYLMSPENEVIGLPVKEVFAEGKGWKRYEVEMTATQTQARARFVLRAESEGVLDVDFVSLFPVNTWLGRKNGLRQDLMQAIYDLNPKHLRFPGGCIVEGHTLENRHQWKHSLGKPEERQGMPSKWGARSNYFAPDYYQSFGLGYYEYFLMAEDLGAEPMPILNCGMACQGRTGEVCPIEDMQSYIQDALDIIEFANGSTETKYGKIRAEMGHPASFNMKMIGVGNENRGEAYGPRLKLFMDAIKEKYPEIEVIASSGDEPPYLESTEDVKKLKPAIRDEHFYKGYQWFLDNAGKYDAYPRDGIKLDVGEYAVCTREELKNSFRGALAEAAFMTGMERNSDLIVLTSYAPLLANINAFVWEPNMIYFNSLTHVRTPNYYVQQLFAQNACGKLVDLTSDTTDMKGKANLYASALINENEIIVKLVNANETAVDFEFSFPKGIKVAPRGEIQTLHHPVPLASNTLDNPDRVIPSTQPLLLENPDAAKVTLQGHSVNILKFKLAE